MKKIIFSEGEAFIATPVISNPSASMGDFKYGFNSSILKAFKRALTYRMTSCMDSFSNAVDRDAISKIEHVTTYNDDKKVVYYYADENNNACHFSQLAWEAMESLMNKLDSLQAKALISYEDFYHLVDDTLEMDQLIKACIKAGMKPSIIEELFIEFQYLINKNNH